jgi:hypothetical protein
LQNLALPFAAISFGTISNDRQNDLISKRISRSVFKTTKAFLDKSLYLNRPGMFSLCFISGYTKLYRKIPWDVYRGMELP